MEVQPGEMDASCRELLDDAVEIANETDDLTHDAEQLLSIVTLIKRDFLVGPTGQEEPDHA